MENLLHGIFLSAMLFGWPSAIFILTRKADAFGFFLGVFLLFSNVLVAYDCKGDGNGRKKNRR